MSSVLLDHELKWMRHVADVMDPMLKGQSPRLSNVDVKELDEAKKVHGEGAQCGKHREFGACFERARFH